MELGGIRLHYELRFEKTIRWFYWHMVPCENESNVPICLSQEMYEERAKEFAEEIPKSFIEYRVLVEPTANILYQYKALIMHAVAFAWKGYAWLLSAPSGTGKTTQYLNWQKIFPNEISMICGDMPVLRADDAGTVYVYPSPWNGKERIGYDNKTSFPLAGIIYLKQSETNQIKPVDFHELILSIWNQFLGIPETKTQIRDKVNLINYLFGKYPIWLYENKGDDESTIILHALFQELLQ